MMASGGSRLSTESSSCRWAPRSGSRRQSSLRRGVPCGGARDQDKGLPLLAASHRSAGACPAGASITGPLNICLQTPETERVNLVFHSRLHVLVVLSLISGLIGVGQAELVAPRALTVSAGRVAGSDENAGQDADRFAERIGMGRDFTGKRARNCSWDKIPKGCVPESHVNVVRLKFGNRLELLAIMPDADGAVALAARAPALFQSTPFFTHRLSSGDNQWPGNAPIDLVATFAYAMERRPESRGDYQLIVKPWEQEEPAEDPDEGTEEGTLGTLEMFSSKGSAVASVHPLAAAAMYAEGFRACTKKPEATIELSFRMDEMECAVHAVLYRGDRKVHELQRHGIQYERLYDSLRALFLNLIEWRGAVTDFFRPGSDGFRPAVVLKTDDREDRKALLLAGMDNDGFVAFEPAAGRKPWEEPFDDRESGACLDGQLFLCRGTRLTKLSAADGKPEFSLTTRSIGRIDVRGDLCAEGLGRQLRLLNKGKEVWSHQLPWPVEAGPLLAEEGVVVGDARGELRCFSLEGDEVWKAKLPRKGDLYSDGGLFFACDDRGALYVTDQHGRLSWQAELGDVVTSAPQVVGAAVVVGSKSRSVFVFDKSTGRCLAKRRFTTWLLGCRVVGRKVLCITLDKRLHVLDLARLEEEAALRFPFRLHPQVLAVSDFPQRRPPWLLDLFTDGERESDVSEKTTGCLLSDIKGNVFLFSVGPAR